MPEMHFSVRWPDGSEQRCYSPSLVVQDHLAPGASYDVPDFVSRVTEAMHVASERVRAKYGFACTSAMATTAAVEARAAEQVAEHATGRVTVTGFSS